MAAKKQHATPSARRLRRVGAHLTPPVALRQCHCSGAAASAPAAADPVLPAPLVVAPLTDGRTGLEASFGREIRGLRPAELLEPLSPTLCEACRMLLARRGVVALRFQRALSVAELQGAVALFGRVKEDQAPMADGSGTMPYLHYDHFGSPRELKGSGLMEHRSGLVLPSLLRGLFKAVSGQGGDVKRPFVYEGFHTDDSYVAAPAGATLLHARALPPSGGGDTLFLDMAAACAALAQREPQRLSALRGMQAVHAHNNEDAFPPRPSASPSANDKLLRPRHPIIRRHHLTGEPALYWDLDRATGAAKLTHFGNAMKSGDDLCLGTNEWKPSPNTYRLFYAGEVDGLSSQAEGQALLQSLQDAVEGDGGGGGGEEGSGEAGGGGGLAPCYAHRWCDWDVLVWDNAVVQHAASGDFAEGEKRTMWRCLLEGEPPQPYL